MKHTTFSVVPGRTVFSLLFLGSAFLMGSLNPAQAVVILPVSATASSENAGGSRLAANAIDGSGLSGNQHTNAPDSNNMWLNLAFAEDPADAWFKIDLGGSFVVDSIQLWNYNETAGLNRGFQTADIWSSSTGTGTPTSNPGSWQIVTNDQAFAQAPGTSTYTGESIGLGGVTTNFILFDDIANYGTAFGANQVGLSEVQVSGNAVPEPSRTALLALGAFAFAQRRRR